MTPTQSSLLFYRAGEGWLKAQLRNLALEDEQMLLPSGGLQSIRFRAVLDVAIADIQLMLEKLDRCLCRLA